MAMKKKMMVSRDKKWEEKPRQNKNGSHGFSFFYFFFFNLVLY